MLEEGIEPDTRVIEPHCRRRDVVAAAAPPRAHWRKVRIQQCGGRPARACESDAANG